MIMSAIKKEHYLLYMTLFTQDANKFKVTINSKKNSRDIVSHWGKFITKRFECTSLWRVRKFTDRSKKLALRASVLAYSPGGEGGGKQTDGNANDGLTHNHLKARQAVSSPAARRWSIVSFDHQYYLLKNHWRKGHNSIVKFSSTSYISSCCNS